MAWHKTDLGLKVIVNQRYQGLIFNNELSKHLQQGDPAVGYVKNIRSDGKMDLILERPGNHNREEHADRLLQVLKQNRGYLNLTDKSEPEAIKAQVGMSKKAFKKAVGALYKQRILRIEETGLFLIVGNHS